MLNISTEDSLDTSFNLPNSSDTQSGIGTKPTPIMFQTTSGSYLKKAWVQPVINNMYQMYEKVLQEGAYIYRDYNGNSITESTFNAVQTKINSPDNNFDEIPAIIGDTYATSETIYPTDSRFSFVSGSLTNDAGFDEHEFFVVNYNSFLDDLDVAGITPGTSSPAMPYTQKSGDDATIPKEDWQYFQYASISDINALLSKETDTYYPDKVEGSRIIYKEIAVIGGHNIKMTLKFSFNLPYKKYTAGEVSINFATSVFLLPIGIWEDWTRHSAALKGTFEYADGSTSTEETARDRISSAFTTVGFFADSSKLNSLRYFTIEIEIPVDQCCALMRRGFIAIESVKFIPYTYGDVTSQAVYQLNVNLPYHELSVFEGVDLGSTQTFDQFYNQIDYIQYRLKAEFPESAGEREIAFVKPTTPSAKHVDQDWIEMKYHTFTSYSVDETFTISDAVGKMQILLALVQSSTQSNEYQIGIRIFSKEVGGDENSKIKLDYFSMSIHLKDYSEGPAISDLNYDRDDPSKITWTFTKQIYPKWGLAPLAIILEDLPLDHVIIFSTWSRIEETNAGRKSAIMSVFGALPVDAVIITESPNYLEQIKTFAIKEVMTKLAGMQTRILQIESSTFLKESKVRFNVTCKDLDYLGTDAFLRYNLESSGEIKYTSLLSLCPDTDLRNYSLDVNLNQIETLEKGINYDQFAFYINSNNPDEAGFLFLPTSFEIRKNDIMNPAFEWGDTYINYTFETNASSEYSVLVVQYNWEWHPEDFIFETNAKNYTANLTSGAILLSNVSIDFPYIFDNIDRHRTYPNPTFTFYFNNTDLGNPYDIILDEVSVVPYFYYEQEPAKSRILFNRTDFEPITIDPNAEISIPVNLNYTQCNQTFQRGVYRLHVEFHETSSEHNSTYFNATLLMDGDYHDIGNILNFTIYEGLTGEQAIKGNFTKNPDTSAIACYIMDNEGYGDGTFLSFDRHGVFYGNQESPQVTIISPKPSEAYITSLIPVNARIFDPDFNKDNASLHLFNEIWDLGWIDYPSSGDYHLMNLNPFDLTTGRIYIEVVARDLTLNYAFATSSFYCESYKDAIVNTTQIQIGSVNAESTIQKVPCNVFVNFSNYDLLTRRIQLGSDFTDATGLKIQRSPLDIYYPQNKPELGMSPAGDITYWKFFEVTENDTLTFSLNSPLVEWQADGEFSTSTRKVFGARIKRHTNLRTYTNVHIIGDFSSLNLQNIRVYITDTTGGTNISITDNCSLKYGYIGKHNDYFRVNFTVPLIIKGTDYAFKVAIVEDVSTEIKNYASGFFIGIMIGAVGAGVIRELVRILKKQPKPKGRSQILRFYLPAILIGVALGCVAGYFWLSG